MAGDIELATLIAQLPNSDISRLLGIDPNGGLIRDDNIRTAVNQNTNGVAALNAGLAAEQTARGTVDDYLDRKINSTIANEAQTRGTVDEYLEDKVNTVALNEQNSRIAGDAALIGNIGSLIDTVIPYSGYLNGAVPFVLGDNRNLGWKIPAGQTGLNTFIQFGMTVSRQVVSRLVGRTLKFRMAFGTSDNYAGVVSPAMVIESVGGIGSPYPVTDLSNTQISKNRRIVEFKVQMPLDANAIASLKPYIVCGGGTAGAEQYILLSGIQITIVSSISDETNLAQEMDEVLFRRAVVEATSDSGSLFPDARVQSQIFNGATYRFTADLSAVVGFNIPAGSNGNQSLIQPVLGLSPDEQALLSGCTMAYDFDLYVSSGFSVPFVKDFILSANAYVNMTRNELVSVNRRIVTFEGLITPDLKSLSPYLQIQNTSALAAGVFVELKNVTYRVVKSSDPARSAAQIMSQWSSLRALQKARPLADKLDATMVGRRLRATLATVSLDNGLTITAGTQSFDNPTSINRAVVKIKAGLYSFVNSVGRPYTDIVGDHRLRTRIEAYAPASTSLDGIAASSGLEWYWTGDIEGIDISVKNRRYAIHSDNPNHPVGTSQIIRDCRVEHLGNDEAITYQQQANGNPGGVWPITHAWGTGTSSAWDLRAERSIFIGRAAAIGVHNFMTQADSSKMSLNDCTLISKDPDGVALTISNLGSGQSDVVELFGNTFTGDITYNNSWGLTDLANQPANHTEFLVVGSGNSPAVFQNYETGRALRIVSSTTGAGSSISMTGSAVPILFGPQVFTKNGAKGIAGYVYGWADIAEHGVGLAYNVFITALGKRLGDCTNAPKILGITVNNGSVYNVVFNRDYTNATNASILAEINFVLGSAATANEYNIGGRYRPHLTDEEKPFVNTSDTTILMGMACAFNTDGLRNIRTMTSSDPAALFAGVAWEDIYPGSIGRVKNAGALPSTDLLGLAGSLALGSGVGVGATPGQWAVGASIPLLRGMSSKAVLFIGAK